LRIAPLGVKDQSITHSLFCSVEVTEYIFKTGKSIYYVIKITFNSLKQMENMMINLRQFNAQIKKQKNNE